MGDIYHFGRRKAYGNDRRANRPFDRSGNREYGLYVIFFGLLLVLAVFGAFDFAGPQSQQLADSPTNLHVTLTQGER